MLGDNGFYSTSTADGCGPPGGTVADLDFTFSFRVSLISGHSSTENAEAAKASGGVGGDFPASARPTLVVVVGAGSEPPDPTPAAGAAFAFGVSGIRGAIETEAQAHGRAKTLSD